VIDAPGWRHPGAVPKHFLPVLDEQIPVPSAGLHAVGVPLGDGRAVVCAVPRDRLLRLESDPLRAELFPSGVPASIDEAARGLAPAPSNFNLLVGEFEPARFRRARRRRVLTAAAATLVVCVVLSIGFERRASHWREVATSARLATDQLVARADLGGTEASLEVVSASVDRLHAIRTAAAQAAPSPDAALALAQLLRGWPASASSETQSISIAGGIVSVSTTVRGDPRTFLDALQVPADWTLDEPRLNSVGDLTRLTLSLRPALKHTRPPADAPGATEGHP
jgi:hypothetical protein